MFRRRPPKIDALGGGRDDRRTTYRTPAAKVLAMLGWWDGAEFLTSPAVLIDISLSGARTITRVPPPPLATIWLRLEGPPASDWLESTTLEVRVGRGRGALVRLQFREGCSYEFFQSATRIDASGEWAPEFDASGSPDHFWHDTYWR